MRRFLQYFGEAFRKGDLILLLMCVVTNIFGCLIISSATNAIGSTRFLVFQIAAALIGVFLFVLISSVDAEVFSEHRRALVVFNTMLLLLLLPFGTDNGTGNRSWLQFPLIPFDIQPAEICKISFVLIMASVMASHQNRLSNVKSVFHMAFHLALLAGLNMVLSRDAGVSLIFVFIFIGMAFAGGVSLIWYLIGGGALVLAAPIIWNMLDGYQRNRIEVLFNPNLDPNGIGARYHTVRSLRSLTGGALTGQGLFEGNRTQSKGILYAQHTDYIFSAIGEELGFIGCILVITALFLIVVRCIWVGVRSQDYMRRLICFGAASALIFQVISNVGMCIGLTPVIGLTLPFISYGGSSLLSLYIMLGLVSGVYARPSATSHERYIRPPLHHY
jgi:rod shape determining protein RodA